MPPSRAALPLGLPLAGAQQRPGVRGRGVSAVFLQDRRYADLTEDQLPTCESLKDTIARALPFWNEEIVPQIKEGKRVLIAAHGNSLRGIVKHLEGRAAPRGAWGAPRPQLCVSGALPCAPRG